MSSKLQRDQTRIYSKIRSWEWYLFQWICFCWFPILFWTNWSLVRLIYLFIFSKNISKHFSNFENSIEVQRLSFWTNFVQTDQCASAIKHTLHNEQRFSPISSQNCQISQQGMKHVCDLFFLQRSTRIYGIYFLLCRDNWRKIILLLAPFFYSTTLLTLWKVVLSSSKMGAIVEQFPAWNLFRSPRWLVL